MSSGSSFRLERWTVVFDLVMIVTECVSLKAYCGFKGHREEPAIATGKWGCGAFNGDPQLKGEPLALRWAAGYQQQMRAELFL